MKVVFAACAAGIAGGYFVLRKHISDFEQSLVIPKNKYENCFLIDRTLDANCNGHRLAVGIWGSKQGIRYGDSNKIYFLNSMTKTENEFLYLFENNTVLAVKKVNGKFIYEFTSADVHVEKELPLGMMKPIAMNVSSDLDKLADLK